LPAVEPALPNPVGKTVQTTKEQSNEEDFSKLFLRYLVVPMILSGFFRAAGMPDATNFGVRV
jgi:hypothetical protein